MKKILFTSLLIITISNVIAQSFQVGLNGYGAIVMGDITQTDLNNPSAGYVLYSEGGSLEFLYHTKKKFAFGFRPHYSSYTKDIHTYKDDLTQYLGVSDSNIMIQSLYTYSNMGVQLGIAYQFDVSEIFSIEPYFFLGGNIFTSPAEQVTYFKKGTTYIQKKPITAFVGFSYSPGVKFQWIILDGHLGLNAFLEYNAIVIEPYAEETITYSNNSFDKKYVQRDYSINAINIGIGVFYRFGKGVSN